MWGLRVLCSVQELVLVFDKIELEVDPTWLA